MTIAEINTFATSRTGADTTKYATADRLISTNRWYHKVQDMILDSIDLDFEDGNLSSEAIVSKDLTGGQKYVTLALTDNILKIKRVEIALDGSNYYRAVPINKGEINTSLLSTSDIAGVFSQEAPKYEQVGLLFYVYPYPTDNVTAGLKLWVSREIDEFTSAQVTTGTKVPGFDKAFHPMIALGLCYDYFITKKNLKADAKACWDEISDYEIRLRRRFGSKSIDSAASLQADYIDYS